MTNTTMKQLAFAVILLIGGAVCAIDLFWRSPATIAADELLVLLHADDAATMEAGLVERYQASPAQAQRIRRWIQDNRPIRGLALKKNGRDGYSLMPEQASHYVAIMGKQRKGYLAVNVVAEQSPHSVLHIVNDDLGGTPIPSPEGTPGQ